VNTVKSPTRITKSTSTLIDVIITNKKYYMELATVIELGFSDHQAQVLPVLRKNHASVNRRVLKRHFGDDNIWEFKYLLKKVTWQEVFSETEVNMKFTVFMNPVLHFFDTAFPLEFRHRKKPLRNGWITQDIKMSSKKIRFLNMLKKQPNLPEEAKMYIAKYKIVYKRVIREVKRKEIDKYILHANHKSKAVWHIKNKETGRTSSNKQDIKIILNSEEITNPENVAELFHSYFRKISKKLLKQNENKIPNSENQHLKIKESTKTMFLFPAKESEVEKVEKGLKNKLSAGINEIPDYAVKQCITLLKKPLANIYNASLESGIFPDQLKIAKVVTLYKNGDTRDIQKYKLIALLSVFFKIGREIGV